MLDTSTHTHVVWYLDEAVVELEAEERGEDGGVVGGGVLDGGGDRVLGVRAGVGVEAHLELGTANSNSNKQQQERRRRRAGSGHHAAAAAGH